MKRVSATVIDKCQLSSEPHRSRGRALLSSYLIWLRCPEIASEAQPGQFVMVSCGSECILPRPFSIHQINETGIALFFGVWEGGKGTTWLSERQAGDTIDLLGPLGNSYLIHPSSHNLLLVAGGIGIAPLHFLAQGALSQGCLVRLLLGASTATQLYPRHLLPSEAELVIATEDGTAGKKGMITDLLPDFVDWSDQIFACGPLPMYHDIAARSQKLPNRKPVQISVEVMMGCGRGVCYGCTLKTKSGLKQVCKDGPIFDLNDILWDELNYF